MEEALYLSFDRLLMMSALYEITWKNVVDPGRVQITIWLMRIACWITKATNTHSECVKLIVFPLQHWLHELASLLRYTNVSCIVIFIPISIETEFSSLISRLVDIVVS